MSINGENEQDRLPVLETQNDSYVTQVKLRSFHFEWTIENYRTICKNLRHINSPVFPSGNDDQRKWYLTLYVDRNKPQFLFVKFDNANKVTCNYFVKVSLTIKSLAGEHKFLNLNATAIPFVKWIKFEDLDQKMKWDECSSEHVTVFCDVLVTSDHLRTINIERLTLEKLGYCDPSEAEVSEDSMYDDESFKDFSFHVQEKKFDVHKVILAAKSPVFASMFRTKMVEKSSSSAIVKDIEPEIFERMLQFVYSGKIDKRDLEKSALKLLAAADKYDLKELKNICAVSLYDKLSVDSVLEIVVLADLHSVLKLKDAALTFLRLNLEKVKVLPGFQSVIEDRPHLAIELLELQSKTFVVDRHSDKNIFSKTDCFFDC